MSLLPIPNRITVLIDSREKVPFLFPRTLGWRKDRTGTTHEIIVDTRVVPLMCGDYCLEFPTGVIRDRECSIERKYSARELYNNLFTKDWSRASHSFEKLHKIRPEGPPRGARYLIIEASLTDMATYERRHDLPSGILMDRVVQVAELYGLHLWVAPGYKTAERRIMLGEALLRIMLGHVFHQCLNLDPYPETKVESFRETYRSATLRHKG